MSFESKHESIHQNQLLNQIKEKEYLFKSYLIKQKEQYDKILTEKDIKISESISKLIEENTQLKTNIKSQQSTIDFLNKKIGIYSSLCNTLNDSSEENYSKSKLITSSYEANVNTLSNDYQLTTAKLKDEFQDLLTSLSLLEQTKIRNQMITYQNKILVLYDTIQSKDTYSLNLSYKNDSLMQENNYIKSILMKEKLSLIEEIRQLKQSTGLEIKSVLSQVNSNLDSNQINFNEDKIKISQLSKEINDIKTELIAKEATIKSLANEIQRAYTEVKESTYKLNDYSRIINEKNRIINSDIKSMNQLELNLKIANENNAAMKLKMEEMMKLIEKKNININNLMTQIEVKIASASNEISILRNTDQTIISTLKNEINEKDELIIKLENNVSTLLEESKSCEEQIIKLKKEILQLKDIDNASLIKQYEANNQKSTFHNQKSTLNLKNTSNEINELNHIDELTRKLVIMEDEVKENKAEIRTERDKILKLTIEKNIIEKSNQEQKEQFKDKVNQLAEISQFISNIYQKIPKNKKNETKKVSSSIMTNITDIAKLKQIDNNIDKFIMSTNTIKSLTDKVNQSKLEINSLKTKLDALLNLTSNNNQNYNMANINKINSINKGSHGLIIERLLQEMISMNTAYKLHLIKMSMKNEDQIGKEDINNGNKEDIIIQQINQLEDKVKKELLMLNDRLKLLITYESVKQYLSNFQQQYELIISNLFEALLSFKVDVVNQTIVIIQLPTDKYNEIIEITSKGIESISGGINKWLNEINNQNNQIDSDINTFNIHGFQFN